MGAKKGDSFTMKVGVASDKDQVPSKEAFKHGHEILERLEAEDEARSKPKKKAGKGASGVSRQQVAKSTMREMLKGMLKGGE